MEKQTTNSTAQTLLTIIKWIFSVILFFCVLGSLLDGAIISALLFLIGALLLLPPLTRFWRSKLPFLSNKFIKAAIVFVLFVSAIATNMNIPKPDGNSLSSIKKSSKEMDFDDKEDILIAYIKKDTTDKSLRNITKLGRTGEMFNNGNYSTVHPHDGYIKEKLDTITNVKILQFDPRFRFDERSTYLKNDAKNGTLENYLINFEMDNKGIIKSKKTIITYSKAGTVEYENNEVPDYETFIDKNIIENKEMALEAERRIAEEKKAYDARKKEFEENCLSSWDGSHTKLKMLVKRSMNDPDSFDHVETLYKLYKDYAVVIMKFRGKNAFNATVVNSVTAKVDLKDCEVLEVE